jgi:2-polyprenyl-3-methyl-5-hydroxy-6-metoxy-1,4-benzoquinol methylase
MTEELAYRNRIYRNYATRFQSANLTFDNAAALRWGKAYRHYFRGWLPADKTARILEVACGSGKLLYFLRSLGYTNVVGVDVSPEQVSIARQVADVVEGDATKFLECNAEQFDLVIGLDIVEHFRKDEALRFLDACYSSLKPGGRLILQTPNAGVPWSLPALYGDLTHETFFSPDLLRRTVQNIGFQEISLREMGPVPWGYSFLSSIRWFLWQLIRAGVAGRNIIETGNGRGIYSRVFLLFAIR